MKSLFFQRVEDLCKERGMTITDLALAAEIGAGTVSGWGAGATPRLCNIKKVAEFFNVSRAYLEGKTDDPIDYANLDISGFNTPVYEQILKTMKGNIEQANRQYLEFEKAQAQDALSDPERFALYQNNRRPLSANELEMRRIFSELTTVQQAQVIVYAEEIKNGKD